MSDYIEKLPIYNCHKQVRAAQITNISNYVLALKVPEMVLSPGEKAGVEVSIEWFSKHRPEVGGYFVRYEDGYESYSPQKPFEDGYELAPLAIPS